MNNLKSRKSTYLLMLFSMLVLMIVFLNSFYWPYEEMSKRKILVGIITIIGVGIIPIVFVRVSFLYEFVSGIQRCIVNVGYKMKEHKNKLILFSVLAILGIVLSYMIAYIFSKYVLHTSYNIKLFYIVVAVIIIIMLLSALWKNAEKKPERIFAVISIVLGLICVNVTPSRVGVSWDDEIHYERTLELSNFLNGIVYKADEKNIQEYASNIYGEMGYDRTSDYEYSKALNDSYKAREWSAHEFKEYGVWSVAYIPSAIGIILGRGLGLSYTGVFDMGRIFNLMMYVSLICLAIKKAKSGKVLIATIGLLPTSIFMASNYSYDPWVIGFTILGLVYFYDELQGDKPLIMKKFLVSVGLIVIGCIPKATYLPMLLPLLFVPKRKFEDSKQRKHCYLAVVGAGVFLVATFLLPMLINGAGTGDVRGGADVNSTEQILFILQNPLRYAQILLGFLRDYFSLGFMGPMLQKFAYVGDGYYYGTVVLILISVTFLDKEKNEKNCILIKGASVVGGLVTMALSSTALYISFTGVAANTVAGMQGRYVLPIVFPLLYSLGVEGTTHKINKNAFVCVPLLIIAVSFICNMYELCVLPY